MWLCGAGEDVCLLGNLSGRGLTPLPLAEFKLCAPPASTVGARPVRENQGPIEVFSNGKMKDGFHKRSLLHSTCQGPRQLHITTHLFAGGSPAAGLLAFALTGALLEAARRGPLLTGFMRTMAKKVQAS